MIARSWDGQVPAKHADAFERHLLGTGVEDAATVAGNIGAQVLRAEEDTGRVTFRLVTFWDSWDAVRRFAGTHPQRAVLYPGDEKYGLFPSPTVEHHHVAYNRCTLERTPEP